MGREQAEGDGQRRGGEGERGAEADIELENVVVETN